MKLIISDDQADVVTVKVLKKMLAEFEYIIDHNEVTCLMVPIWENDPEEEAEALKRHIKAIKTILEWMR